MIQTITVFGVCPAGCVKGSALTISITNALNPGSVKPINTLFNVSTYTSAGYLIDTGNAVSIFGLPLVSDMFTSAYLTKPTGVIKVGSTSEYFFLITPKNLIPNAGLLNITLPSTLYLTSTSSCTASSTESSHICLTNSSA